MVTAYVWTLMFYIGVGGISNTHTGGGPAVVDNIASAEECKRVAEKFGAIPNQDEGRWRCVEVKKVFVK